MGGSPAAVVLFIASVASLWAQTGAQYVGAGGCSGSNCHGATGPQPESQGRSLGNEYSLWTVRDKHSKAYGVLANPRSRRMAEILKLGDPQTSQRCLSCHGVGSPPKLLSDGVACEACHGPAEKWLGPHIQANSHSNSISLGMVDLRNLQVRTENCLSCHLGSKDRTVNHELIAAGHPDLVFELDTFTVAQPMHFREPKPASGNTLPHLQAWAVGQAVALAQAMRQLNSHAATGWPEFSDLECYQCHHDLRADSWRIQRGYAGGKPGGLQLAVWRVEVLRKLVEAAARDEAGPLEAAVSRLESLVSSQPCSNTGIAEAARAVEQRANALANRFSSQEFTADAARVIVKSLAADAMRLASSGVQTAEQITMALDSLSASYTAAAARPGLETSIGKLYDYLEHPSNYQPGEFAAQFRTVAAQIE